MFLSTKLSRALNGLRPLVSSTSKLPLTAAARVDGSEEISARLDQGTGPKLDESALERLLLRAEAELSEPDAVQRREAIAQLKLAAVNNRG